MQAFLLQESSQRYHVCVRAGLDQVPEGRGRQILKRSAGQEFLYNECVTIHKCPVFDDQINQTAVLVGFGVSEVWLQRPIHCLLPPLPATKVMRMNTCSLTPGAHPLTMGALGHNGDRTKSIRPRVTEVQVPLTRSG